MYDALGAHLHLAARDESLIGAWCPLWCSLWASLWDAGMAATVWAA
jgi:hypothetical protein